MSDLPPLNSLRAFDAAGHRLSFRAAAEDLGVTQGAVAQHVRQLETYLELPLFERVPKGLAFTATGRAYHAQISQLFEGLRSATAQLKPQPDKVLISVTPTFAAKWLIPNLPEFTRLHPNIDLRIMATDPGLSFHRDGIDLAVRQGAPPFGAALEAKLLFRQELVPVASPDLVGGTAAQGIQALCDLPKIHDTHDHWPRYLAYHDMKEHAERSLRLSQAALAVDAAIAGQGVALVSRFLVAQEIDQKRLVPLGPPWQAGGHDFYLLAPRAARRREAVADVTRWFTSRGAAGP